MAGGETVGTDVAQTRLERVRDVVDAHVLPYVRNHGGDLEIVDVAADGTVTCRLEGSCRGCPIAPVTVFAVLERALRTHVSPDLNVHAPQIGVSQAAVARIRRFYPSRVGGPQKSAR